MKKLSIIAWAILAVTLWACSKSGPAVDPDTAWVFDETLQVPIKLGGGEDFSVYTKAAEKVTDLDVFDGTDNNYLYVYAVDLHLGVDPVAEGWSADSNYCTKHNIGANQLSDDDYLFGVAGNKPTPLKATVNSSNFIEFTDGARYYPYSETRKVDGKLMHMGKNYSFIAFNTPNMTNSSFKPELVIDPNSGASRLVKKFYLKPSNTDEWNKDVLWARVDAQPGLYPDEMELAADDPANDGYFRGINARYMRKLAEDNAGIPVYPELKFHHAVSMIHIIVKAEEGAGTAIASSGLKVNNLKVNAKYTTLALDVLNGEVFPYPGSSIESSYQLLYPSVDIIPTEAGQEYNQGFFVMPGVRTESEVQSQDERVSITFDIVLPGISPSTKTVALPLPTETKSYKAGTEYTYYISIQSPEQIYLRTSLSSWDSTSGAEELGNQVIPFE